ncbi:RHS repeat-associated core domain-containing protein [Dysgonomonas mossii]|uniref:RHS repeat-associated core domain-containing protein n=1 Tax=Dysgonomonas mossii TaxID=163665 RepID=A0A4Y9II55_9BACT|nr:DUF6443 domain-containing protein [Dysgonomonas mossii]MBF0762525.1 RHS repeat-associated core domain-containing protein [Dysgonomonas mossii]TFU86930.1 RHS repeat-associated core domain-containing protein [Dysgonomonas mossii]
MKQLFTIISFLLISLEITSQVSITLKTPQTTGGTETACQTISLLPGFSFKATSTSGALTLRVNPSTCDPYAGQASSVSTSQNYIQTKTYTTDDGSRYMEAIQYFDGLGRPVQTVLRAITPLAADLVTYQEYDPFGREDRSWLPAVAAGNNGAYMPLANYKTSAMATYRSTTYNTASDSVAYSRPVYEASPLSRVLEQYAPGADWHKNGKGVKTEYLTNGTGADDNGALSCRKYSIIGSELTTKLTYSGGVYDPAQLYVTRMTDENGNKVYEFKDKLGQILLTRSINVLADKTIQHLNTLYVYDDFGNLCYVIPPEGFDKIKDYSDNSTEMKQYAYIYKYDSRNRCILKRLPGCEPIYYVYDKADRLIFTQDGEQRAKTSSPEWTFNKYDAFGRLIISGIYPSPASHASLITKCKDIVVTEKIDPNKYYGYTWNILPEVVYTGSMIINYYDAYDAFPNNTQINYRELLKYTEKSGYGQRYINNGLQLNTPKGQLTATRARSLMPDGSMEVGTVSMLYYDNRGRLIQTKSANHLGGVDEEYIAYNFTGQPTKKMHVHTKDANGGGKQTELYTYTYDHAGRLLTTTHQLTDGTTARPQITLADNTYDELGRLKYNQKGGLASSKTTYGYNIRSWTKSITSPLFSQTLYYNESYGGSKAQYNGNISAMSWKQNNESNTRGYTFAYDDLSRLLSTAYLKDGVKQNHDTEKGATPIYQTAYSYDKHGNIKTLQRYGKTTASAYGLVDNMTLTYAGNQMVNVLDGIQNFAYAPSADFKDVPNAPGIVEYTYNKNGAMNKDLNKGITEIQYNSLNLPSQMVINSSTAKAKNYYTYSASGVKLRTEQRYDPTLNQTPIGTTTPANDGLTHYKNTDYVGNIIYETEGNSAGVVSKTRILVDGGYIEGGVYHYYMTDHLGNNRVVVNASGTVTQRSHYYPFGTAFAENTVDEQKQQPYKYNGKELDQMHGLNLYDYSARYYESAIGRFTSVDPLAEKYYSISPYTYVKNNPLKYTDPTGMYVSEESVGAWLNAAFRTYTLLEIYQRNNTNGQYDQAISYLQLTSSNLEKIWNSENRYEITQLELGSIGGFSYDKEKNTFKIEYLGGFDDDNLYHEITHGGQYENGTLGFMYVQDSNGKIRAVPFTGVNSEIEAYRVSHVYAKITSNKNIEDINTNYVRSIQVNGNDIYPVNMNASLGHYLDGESQYWTIRLGLSPIGSDKTQSIVVGEHPNDFVKLNQLPFMKWNK